MFCYHCKKKIREHSKSAIYMGFIRFAPKGNYEAWVCNKKCLKAYNEEGQNA